MKLVENEIVVWKDGEDPGRKVRVEAVDGRLLFIDKDGKRVFVFYPGDMKRLMDTFHSFGWQV
jgi:hypothetical protein